MEINCPSCDEAVLIADEDKATTIECPFCQQHFRIDSPELDLTDNDELTEYINSKSPGDEPPPAKEPPPVTAEPDKSAQAQEGEKTFFQGLTVLVTNKRVVLGDRTYALKQITSVGRIDDRGGLKTIKGTNIGQRGIRLCAGTFICAILGGAMHSSGSSIVYGFGTIFVIATFGLGMIFVKLAVDWFLFHRDIRHWVEIGTASGKEKALLCNTQEDAQKISDAINDAIIDN